MLIIIGAGVAGIGAAFRAKSTGIDYLLLEKSDSVGGLLDNFSIDGFRFDNAVHLSFATEPEVRELFDRVPYFTHQPESWCFDDGLWLRHPIQNNLYGLDVASKVEIIEGFINRPLYGEPENYQQWLHTQYGYAFCKRFPERYTQKYWTVSAEELGVDWVGNRMAQVDLQKVLTGAMTEHTENAYYAKEMRYPEKGGYKAFIQPMIDEITIQTNSPVDRIDTNNRQVVVNGISHSYKQLISTMPLPELIEKMDNVPEDIQELARSLYATQVDLVSIGFNCVIETELWFYIYDDDILAARAYSPSVKSPDNVPEGKSSLQFEIYSSVMSPQIHSPQELQQNCIYAVEKLGIAEKKDILFTHHKKLPFGNVVFDQGMEERRDRVLEFVRSRNIEVAGRFGEWAYLWSNQSLLSGFAAVDAMCARDK